MAIAIALHVLSAVVWVGGMFFAYVVLRPATGSLTPPERLALWARVLKNFFVWVWVAIALLLATGYWMLFGWLGGFAGAAIHVHIMQGLGIIMMLLFLHLFFAPYRRMKQAVAGQDWAAAGAQLNQIRKMVLTNLILGLLTAALASGGRYFSI